MANYNILKDAIADYVKNRTGLETIDGDGLQQTLLSMVNSLGVGYQYVGIATPETTPGTPDQNVFYLASTAGTYTNFGGIVLADSELAILKYNGSWTKDVVGAATSEAVSKLRKDMLNNCSIRKNIEYNKALNALGQAVEADGWFVTDFVDVSGISVIEVNFGRTPASAYCVLGYDSSKNIVDFWSWPSPDYIRDINVPNSAKYFRFSFCYNGDSPYYAKNKSNGNLIYNDELYPVQSLFDDVLDNKHIFEKEKLANEKISKLISDNKIGTDYSIITRDGLVQLYNKNISFVDDPVRLMSELIKVPLNVDLRVFIEDGYKAEILLSKQNNQTIDVEGDYGDMVHNSIYGYARVYIAANDNHALEANNPPYFFFCYRDKDVVGGEDVFKSCDYVIGARQSLSETYRARSGFIEIPEDAESFTLMCDENDSFRFLVYGIKGDVQTETETDISDVVQYFNDDEYFTPGQVYTIRNIDARVKYLRFQLKMADGSEFNLSTFETKSAKSYFFFNKVKGAKLSVVDFNVASYNVGIYFTNSQYYTEEQREQYKNQIFPEYINQMKSLITFTQEDLIDESYYNDFWKQFYKYHYVCANYWSGIYSKLPLYRVGMLSLSPLHDWSDEYGYPGAYPRNYAYAITKINGKKVLLVSWHGGISSDLSRAEEAQQLIAFCANYDYVIMGADSNSVNGATFEIFQNAGFQTSNWGFWGEKKTWEGTEGIDSIYTKGFNLNSMDVLNASIEWPDHHPVVSNINMEI